MNPNDSLKNEKDNKDIKTLNTQGDSPEKPKNLSLQQSFRVFDSIIKGKNQTPEKGSLTVDTKRTISKTENKPQNNKLEMDLNSGGLRSGRLKLSLLDEENDGESDELNDYNQTQKIDVERKFKHINATNGLSNQKLITSKTSKNLFTKLKKFFV